MGGRRRVRVVPAAVEVPGDGGHLVVLFLVADAAGGQDGLHLLCGGLGAGAAGRGHHEEGGAAPPDGAADAAVVIDAVVEVVVVQLLGAPPDPWRPGLVDEFDVVQTGLDRGVDCGGRGEVDGHGCGRGGG